MPHRLVFEVLKISQWNMGGEGSCKVDSFNLGLQIAFWCCLYLISFQGPHIYEIIFNLCCIRVLLRGSRSDTKLHIDLLFREGRRLFRYSQSAPFKPEEHEQADVKAYKKAIILFQISQKAMGLLTVLEPGERPQIATWYTLVPRGECPDVRVGHTLTFVPDTSEEGKVIIVGGANPNGSFSDAHVLDLGRLEWDVPEWKGLLPRYEHSSFISASKPGDLWLFGGADECSNRNCVQVLNFETGLWRSPTINGTPPTPRTCHGSTAAIGDCLYVFGGGDKGAEPVQDTQLYMFDKATLSWSQQSTEGNPPAPRHGHVMIAVGSKLFIHGGLSGDTFFNDMHVIDTAAVNMRWKKIKMKGNIPKGCAAHSAIYHGKYIFIFGGMDVTGALNTMYKYHIETSCWTLLEFGPLLPAGRLDHAMSVIPWKIRKENEASIPAEKNSDEQSPKGNTCEKSSQQSKADENLVPRNCSIVQNQTMNIVHLCLVFGGMDTQGEIYNDCFVTLVDGY